jgi:hypothetical protein
MEIFLTRFPNFQILFDRESLRIHTGIFDDQFRRKNLKVDEIERYRCKASNICSIDVVTSIPAIYHHHENRMVRHTEDMSHFYVNHPSHGTLIMNFNRTTERLSRVFQVDPLQDDGSKEYQTYLTDSKNYLKILFSEHGLLFIERSISTAPHAGCITLKQWNTFSWIRRRNFLIFLQECGLLFDGSSLREENSTPQLLVFSTFDIVKCIASFI